MPTKNQNAEALPGWLLHLLNERAELTRLLQKRFRLLVQATPDVQAANEVSLAVAAHVTEPLGLSKRENVNPYQLVETILTLPSLYASTRYIDAPERVLDYITAGPTVRARVEELVAPLDFVLQRRLA